MGSSWGWRWLPFSSALVGGKASKDGGDHLVMILKGIIIAPRWSVASIPIGVVIQLLVLELLGQAKAVFHLMLCVLVERARTIEDLLILLVIVPLGARLIDSSNEVVWSAATILTGLEPFWPIMAVIPVETTVVVAAVVVASGIGAVIVAVRRAICARIFVETHLRFLSVGILVGGRDHLADARRRLTVEFGPELMVVKSSNKGGDDLSFRDIGDRIPHLGEASDVAKEELG